ncbi:MAG: GNAT family N-acetyltransferase [Leucobacter sp.]
MSQLRLEELSAATIVAVNNLGLKPGQEQFITPVSYAAAAAVTPAHSAWQRVVLNEDNDNRVVGFIHGNFDPDNAEEEFRAALWRINVDAEAQGMGVGSFAVRALLDEAQRRGVTRLTVLWERGEEGPEAFFLHMGFTPVGETPYGEVIGAIDLE